jgi:hypothetical protein
MLFGGVDHAGLLRLLVAEKQTGRGAPAARKILLEKSAAQGRISEA